MILNYRMAPNVIWNVIKICPAVLELKHADRRIDTISPMCVYLVHIVQRTHNNLNTSRKHVAGYRDNPPQREWSTSVSCPIGGGSEGVGLVRWGWIYVRVCQRRRVGNSSKVGTKKKRSEQFSRSFAGSIGVHIDMPFAVLNISSLVCTYGWSCPQRCGHCTVSASGWRIEAVKYTGTLREVCTTTEFEVSLAFHFCFDLESIDCRSIEMPARGCDRRSDLSCVDGVDCASVQTIFHLRLQNIQAGIIYSNTMGDP
jgi:hypothetical protein